MSRSTVRPSGRWPDVTVHTSNVYVLQVFPCIVPRRHKATRNHRGRSAPNVTPRWSTNSAPISNHSSETSFSPLLQSERYNHVTETRYPAISYLRPRKIVLALAFQAAVFHDTISRCAFDYVENVCCRKSREFLKSSMAILPSINSIIFVKSLGNVFGREIITSAKQI